MAAPAVQTNENGYTTATVKRDGGQRLDEVTIKPFVNGGFQVVKQYRKTRDGKRAMSTPDWLPPEPPLRADTFEAMVTILRKCFGVTKDANRNGETSP